jgi:uncharacterized membrane protein YeiH
VYVDGVDIRRFFDAEGTSMNDLLAATASFNITQALGGRTTSAIFICGVFVFGLSGGLAGAQKKLDIFGVTVLAGVVGVSGGALRDLFIGIPAMRILDWRIVVAVTLAGTLAFFAHRPLLKLHYPIQFLDAMGLSLFSVIGADLALIHHSGLLGAALLGMATGITGGVVRDLLLNEVPQVLGSGLYALPSFLASGLVVLGYQLKELSFAWCAVAGLSCLVLRIWAIVRDINLPPAS